jgi:KipI family sensor histidine kinase inhibitor
MTARILAVGACALLIELDEQAEVLGLYREIERRREGGWQPGLKDVVPAARTILLDGVEDQELLRNDILTWPKPELHLPDGPAVTVPTTYDGEDLEAVAATWRMTVMAAVKVHLSIEFQVAFCGFSPGFAYLSGLPEELIVPRRDTPRAVVPAGSVALAGEYSGIYPRSSPGGWQLIGRTKVKLWDPGRRSPALLVPGMQVRFMEVKGRGSG